MQTDEKWDQDEHIFEHPTTPVKTCFQIRRLDKSYMDQSFECRAPKCWSKNTLDIAPTYAVITEVMWILLDFGYRNYFRLKLSFKIRLSHCKLFPSKK